mmetsp:Transcript_35104/g.113647  ORF Transcript_35104/g.113647 Transcript_35104/m.113647 type:complete len:257 (+) Transcript_35104:156-926(+)
MYATRLNTATAQRSREGKLRAPLLHPRNSGGAASGSTAFLGNRQEELELRRQLLFAVETVREVDAADAAVRMQLHPQGLDVVRAVGAAREVGQVELDLVPALIEAHRHRADEGLHARGALVVRGPESAAHLLVIQHGDLESEVLLQVLDDHHEEGQLNAQRLARIRRASDIGGAHVRAHDLEDARLDVGVGQTLDVAIAHLLVPDLQGLTADRVQDGQEPRLVGVLEHLADSATRSRARTRANPQSQPCPSDLGLP